MHKTPKSIPIHYILVILLCLVDTGFSQKIIAGFVGGANGGPGFTLQAGIEEPAKGFPFMLRLGLGYTSKEPGNAADARKIFINNATNGIPEKKGRTLDARLDFLYRVVWFSWQRFYLSGGPRFSHFKANFKYIGGNEDFDVRSKQWGLGLGLEKYYAVNPQIDLTLAIGVDYFAKTTLQGHDTSYSPDGETVNGREDFTFKDADKAINQPFFVPRVLIGVTYNFGD